MIKESKSPKETALFAGEFAATLKKGDIIRLHGEIGVGKTVFVRGVAEYFGCADDVCSPTFAIMNIYASQKGACPLYHFDLYRFESEEEIYDAGLDEFLSGDGISLVEWPELIKNYPAERVFDVTIEKVPGSHENYRRITIA